MSPPPLLPGKEPLIVEITFVIEERFRVGEGRA